MSGAHCSMRVVHIGTVYLTEVESAIGVAGDNRCNASLRHKRCCQQGANDQHRWCSVRLL